MIRTSMLFLVLSSLLYPNGLQKDVAAKAKSIYRPSFHNGDNPGSDSRAPQKFSSEPDIGILLWRLGLNWHCSSTSLDRRGLCLYLLTGGAISVSYQKSKADVQEQDTVMKFFYLVNKSGFEVELRVLADDEELFVQRLKAKPADSPGITHPSNGQYSTLELKVPMNKHAKQLTVQERSHLKKSKTFEITETGKEGAGFQVIIGKDEITLIQDYYPAR